MAKLIVYGNCQADALFEVLKHIPQVSQRWDVVRHDLSLEGERLDGSLTDFYDCDVLLQQSIRNWDHHPICNCVADTIMHIKFPFYYLGALWPFDGHQNGNDPGWYHTLGEAQFEYSDSLLGRLRQAIPDPEERFCSYSTLDVPGIVNIRRYAEFEETRLLREDEQFGLTIGRYIVENYRQKRLFHTITHPAAPLLTRMTREILWKLDIPACRVESYVKDFLGWNQVPIHPRVAELLGLAWVVRDGKYNFVNREQLSFEEYYRRYIRCFG